MIDKKIFKLPVSLTLLFVFLFLGYGYFNSLKVKGVSDSTFYYKLSSNTSSWDFENSGSVEKITKISNGWLLSAGGVSADTHFARIKYKLPEKSGVAPTKFYMKARMNLPSDFYDKQKASLRLMNTDNFTTTLNGSKVGANNADELRTAVYIYRDHLMRIITTHENNPERVLWKSTSPIPVGDHTFELYGSVSEVSPWYFKIDGKTIASGVDRLSPDTVSSSERVVTRMVVGIDGAADQDANPMELTVYDFEIANYDPTQTTISTYNAVTNPTSTPIPTPKPTKSPSPMPTANTTSTVRPTQQAQANTQTTSNSNTDTKPPQINLISPANNTKVGKILNVSASANDASGVKFIKIYVNNKLVKGCKSDKCNYSRRSWWMKSGKYKIKVVAVDNSKNENQSELNIEVVK